jgi:protein-tyrosine phosphatase
LGLFSNIFKKKQPLLPLADLSVLKNDIHSHLIPGIDDGAQTMSDSLEMLKIFQDSGYKKVITTPHIMSDYYRNTPQIINTGLSDLKREIKSNGIDIEIEAAAEYNVEPDFEEIIKNNNVLTFGGKNKYVLIELSFFSEPNRLNETIWALNNKGYSPVLAHVERYTYWHKDLDKITEMINRGVKLQLNIGSLTGAYGPEINKVADWLVDEKIIDLVGTDCHHLKHLDMLQHARRLPKFHELIVQEQLINSTL